MDFVEHILQEAEDNRATDAHEGQWAASVVDPLLTRVLSWGYKEGVKVFDV